MVLRTLANVTETPSSGHRRKAHSCQRLLRSSALSTAQIITLPVAGAVGTFAPVFLHVIAVDAQFVCGALIKTREVAAQHYKVGAHGKSKRDVIIMNDAAVGADGNINSGFFEVFVPRTGHFNDRRSLSAANAFGFAGDADRTAANADLHKICTSFCEKTEAVAVNHVAGAYFYAIAVFFADPGDGAALPLSETLRRVDAQNIRTGFTRAGTRSA